MVEKFAQFHMVLNDILNSPKHTFDLEKYNEMIQHYLNNNLNPKILFSYIFGFNNNKEENNLLHLFDSKYIPNTNDQLYCVVVLDDVQALIEKIDLYLMNLLNHQQRCLYFQGIFLAKKKKNWLLCI